MITVSICMIVKDEEAVLERCLCSLQGIGDEIILVDTGSTDRTKEIAAGYTDKIYDFPWIHDFSAARNFSFSKASMEYIYVADADEVLDETNRQRFLLLKQNLLPEIEIVQMMYGNQLAYNTTYNFDEEYRPKLYKRLRTFRWMEPIHESVALNPVVFDSDIVIWHMPVTNHAGRDFEHFLRVIREQGTLSPRLYEMYAKELYIAGQDSDFEAACTFFQAFADWSDRAETTPESVKDSSISDVRSEAPENEEITAVFHSRVITDRERKIYECILVKCYRLRGDVTGMMKYSLHNVADGKGSAEVCYELGEYFMGNEDYKEAVIWYYNAAYETECELNIHYSGDYPLKRLAECYAQLGNQEQEEAYLNLHQHWSI